MAGQVLMPPLSCLPVSLYPDFRSGTLDLSQWVAVARRLGLDAVDLNVLIARTNRIRPEFPVDTIAAYTDFTHPDKRVRESEFSRFMKDVGDGVAIGARYLRITAGQAHPQTTKSQGLEWATQYLLRAATFAGRNNIGLLFENHSRPGVWQYYDFAGEPVIYFELLRRLKGSDIDLLFDTANACFYHQNPLLMLEQILPRVTRIHVADIDAGENLKPVTIGNGIVPLTDIFRFLKNNRFRGALSIEEASFRGMPGIEEAVRITRELWHNA